MVDVGLVVRQIATYIKKSVQYDKHSSSLHFKISLIQQTFQMATFQNQLKPANIQNQLYVGKHSSLLHFKISSI